MQNLHYDLQEMIDHVKKLTPNVTRHGSLFDEEQERELEEEIEEETQIERPGAAEPILEKHISKGLTEILTPLYSRNFRAQRTFQFDNVESKFDNVESFTKLSNLLKDTSLYEQPPFYSENVFLTSNFLLTIKGDGHKDSFLKNIRWILRANPSTVKRLRLSQAASNSSSSKLQPRDQFLIVSNLEAEVLAPFLVSPISPQANSSQNQTSPYTLHPFTPVIRVGQPSILRVFEIPVPPMIHVLAGSIQIQEPFLRRIKYQLGLVNQTHANKIVWEKYHK